MRMTGRLAAGAAAFGLVLGLAACGGGSGGSSTGNGPSTAPAGKPKHGGTATIAEVGASPNFIFPLAPATNTDGYNVNLTQPMWPPLVYSGDGAKAIVNPQESLFSSIAYGDGDKTVTIGLKPWKWSDGQPVTSRDFTFVYNLLKANAKDWIDYVSGLFPDDVTSVATPNAHTVVLHLDRSYNPAFYTDDVLSEIQLLPQHAWDKTSLTGAVKNYDESTAGAKAVWKFLQKEGGQISGFTTNPLWTVVDGPWKLASFNSNGAYSYVPNKSYSGPDEPYLNKVSLVPFTTDTAELNALRSGGSLDVGNLPLNDVQQEAELKADGYSIAAQPVPGVAEIYPNFYNSTVGVIFRQLYVRQAMEDLINRPQIVSKVYAGYADPGNGPVPVLAGGPWVSPLEKAGGPYPYAPSKAISLLKAHGWKVAPNGVTTCQKAGTASSGCGPGIAAGAALNFTLAYSSGDAATDEQEAAIQSSEAQAGIKIQLKSEPFNTLIADAGVCNGSSHPTSTCGWQLVDFGYEPYALYPAGDGYFDTDGYGNQGGYSSPELDNLIKATEYGSSAATFFAYEDFAARQLPGLWIPDQSFIQVYKSNLQGFAPLNPFSGGLNPEVWWFSS
jgi:peptide/nickel transport system substrate-binding protein